MTPSSFTIGNKQVIRPVSSRQWPREELILDPAGILCMFEPPRSSATYVMGVDPTIGVTGWSRHFRSGDDGSHDPAAIEVLRVGSLEDPEIPDVQVAEWVAPVDPVDLADVANAIGRLYGGSNEDGQALAIVEVYPGPGMTTLRRMIDVHGYTNHFIWKYHDSMILKQTGSMGWYSSPKSVRDLWINGLHRMKKRMVKIHSPWLVEELCEIEMDVQKMRGRAIYGAHDDRTCAILFAEWAAHEPTGQVETVVTEVQKSDAPVNWQASDMSNEAMMAAWEERWEELLAEQ